VSFWDAFDFWRDSMMAVLLAATVCSILGVYVVLRRVVFVGAALTQVSGVGVALAFWIASFMTGADPHGDHPGWIDPQAFSLGAALIAAISFSFVRGGRRIASETLVGLLWVLASSILLLVLSSKRIVQEAHEVDDLLYGSAVLVRLQDVITLAWVTGAIVLVHLLSFKEFVFMTYDAEMAQTLGYKTVGWDILFYATLGVGVSFAVRTVGMLPTFGFLAIPSSAALLLVRRIYIALPLAVVFGICGGALGYYVAFTYEWPTGASIVCCSAVFLIPGVVMRAVRRDA
jgi:zinc transport system permease protein